jgi:hypothetical protein
LILLFFSNTLAAPGVIDDDLVPEKSAKSLKTNGSEKRRNHRQKSSFIVRTGVSPLNSLNNKQPFISLP